MTNLPTTLNLLRRNFLYTQNAATKLHGLQAVIKQLWHESEIDNVHMNTVYNDLSRYLKRKENQLLHEAITIKEHIKMLEAKEEAGI